MYLTLPPATARFKIQRWITLWLTIFALAAFVPSTFAQSNQLAYETKAAQLLECLKSDGGEQQFFSNLFLSAVPLDRWRAITKDLRSQHGAPIRIVAIRVNGPTGGQVDVAYDHATVGFNMVISPDQPHSVIGLRVVGISRTNDSFEKILSDFQRLEGRSSLLISRLSSQDPVPMHGFNASEQMATASSFKLILLAEASRAVRAGERSWKDIIPLDRKSFSGRLNDYPLGAPISLFGLSAAMIAESDNSASDTLLHALGRDKIDIYWREINPDNANKTLPILGTAEAFALKMPDNKKLRAAYAAASPSQRLAMLKDHADQLTADKIDIGSVAETPVAIDSIEWFASPNDEIRLLNRLRDYGGDTLAILAINPGVALADAKRWRYIGYKGGSEPGVIAMNFLTQSNDGQWYAISGMWNNPASRVDDAKFVALMTRALNLLSR